MYLILVDALIFIASLFGVILGVGEWKMAFFLLMMMSVMCGMTLVHLSVISEYIAQIMTEVKGRPISLIYDYRPSENSKERIV